MACFLNSVGNRATPGERRFAERLRCALENDYLCWFNVPVGPARQYPDFVVLHPRRGILILEVKDWTVGSIRRFDKLTCEVLTPEGKSKTLANPLEQARSYCMTVVNRLSTDPQLQDTSDRYRGKICFPYGFGVVLPNITRRQFDSMLSEEEQDLVLPSRLVICRDEMSENCDPEIFEERLGKMFQYLFGPPLTLPQIERIRWHLFPEIRIAAIQDDFFAEPISGGADQTIPEIVRVMDIAQEQLARSLGDGHRVIHGVAGSGKTLILGYRCRYLAQILHKPILVLCFNITLAAKLRSLIQEKEIADRVQVYHFHDWCKAQIATYHVDLVAADKQPWERSVASVIQGVADGLIPRAQYGAVMIDEGHDFEPEWLKLISQMTDPVTDSLLLLYDDAQSIYRKSSGLNFSLSSVGIKAQGRTTILRLNYRNTREVLAFAYNFASAFLEPTDADDDHIPLIRPEAAGISGPPPAVRHHASIEAEIHFAAQCVAKWYQTGTPLSEIAILYFRSDHGGKMADRLNESGIPNLWMGNHNKKVGYNPQQQQVALMSLQSSKGLEFQAVIILGVGHMERSNVSETDSARLLYVGMTRAKEKLLLTASAKNAFTERLTALAA